MGPPLSGLPRLFAEAHRYHQAGQLSEAERCYRAVLQGNPRHAHALHLLGVLAHQRGHHDASEDLIKRAILENDREPAFHCNLGNALKAQARLEPAVAAYRCALSARPDYAEANYNLGITLEEQGALGAAVTSYRRALGQRPEFAEAHYNLGCTLQEQGRLDEAIASFEAALAVRPDYPEAAMNLAFTHLYRPGVTLAEVMARARAWDSHFARRLPQTRHPRPRQSDHRQHDQLPRLGFVSGDFHSHAVGFLVIPAIEGLARSGFHLTCYSNSFKHDATTQRYIGAATLWRSVAGLTDTELAAQIEADGVDILIDLAGYSAGNRMFVFARRPAPIQVAGWVGYPATSGLGTMDYILADRYQVPEGSEQNYCEAVVRLPDSYIVFEPPRGPMADAPLNTDRAARGGIVFGSFNVLKKINADVIAAWSRILDQVPGSHLLLKAGPLGCPDTRRRYMELFAGQGIPADRLQFVGATAPSQHMAWMQMADIALDPFPYSGGRTTLELLWMGLPVITWPGETFGGRHTLSYLSNCGLDNLVATSHDHYVELAVGLALDQTRLAELQRGLRSRLECSAMCDIDRFTANLGAALTTMWRRWCAGQPPASFDIAR